MNPQQLQLVNYLKGPCPISKDKFNDLKEICQKGIIPETYHDFFSHLHMCNTIYHQYLQQKLKYFFFMFTLSKHQKIVCKVSVKGFVSM